MILAADTLSSVVKLSEIQLTDAQDIAIEPSHDRSMLASGKGVHALMIIALNMEFDDGWHEGEPGVCPLLRRANATLPNQQASIRDGPSVLPEQSRDDVRRRVGGAAGRHELRDAFERIPRRDDGWFEAVPADLWVAHGRHERIADALPARHILGVT